MPLSNRRRGGASNGLDAWPGYVDALSTLLMVIIFVLLVFVLGQAFLSVALTGKDRALDKLGHQVAELSDMLSLERGRTRDLERTSATLGSDLAAARAELDRTVATSRDTLQQKLADLAKLREQTTALTALRDDLEHQVGDAAARSATADQQRAAAQAQLAGAQAYSDSARAQIALLNHQLDQLRTQMQQTAAALDLQTAQGRDKDAQIAALGQKLNLALASKVEELQRYRSEFFGRLRAVLADRPGIQIVGDRFVFQSEVLFPGGSATLSPAGEEQVHALATTLKSIIPEIPADIAWLLRVDGHADHDPITGGPFASNWELSSQRAITVVKLLIASAIPAEHLAATGFADFQPLEAGSTSDAYARNRRIELRFTDR
jgi:chemotaxis protein MotB